MKKPSYTYIHVGQGKAKALLLVCCRVAVAPSLPRINAGRGSPPPPPPRARCIACAGLRGRRRVPPWRARPKAPRHRCLRPPANGGSHTDLSHAVRLRAARQHARRVQGEEAAPAGRAHQRNPPVPGTERRKAPAHVHLVNPNVRATPLRSIDSERGRKQQCFERKDFHWGREQLGSGKSLEIYRRVSRTGGLALEGRRLGLAGKQSRPAAGGSGGR